VPSIGSWFTAIVEQLLRRTCPLRRFLDATPLEAKGLKHNPALGRNFETMDPLEWLARMADHIPDTGKHRTLFYG